MTKDVNFMQESGTFMPMMVENASAGNNKYYFRSWDYQNQPPPDEIGPNPPAFTLRFHDPGHLLSDVIEDSDPAGTEETRGGVDYLEFVASQTTKGGKNVYEVMVDFKKTNRHTTITYPGQGLKYDVVMTDGGGVDKVLDPRLRPR